MGERRALRLALVLCVALAGCEGGGGSVDAALDAPLTYRDAGPPLDARRPPPDSGPIEHGDAGPCDAPRDLGEPIEGLVEGTWVYVPFDEPGQEAFCMNGTTTGIGVNLGSSPNVAIFLEGGGACFEEISCSTVAGQGGFGASDLPRFAPALDNYGIFRRSDEDNPIRDWSYVYVPYCTGDIHGGTNPDGEGRMHVGWTNMQRYLRRLVPTFASAEQVLLTGLSAGGFGALVNYDQTQTAFGCTPVHLLDDSGPAMDDPFMRPCLQERVEDLWGLAIPDDCPQCRLPGGGGIAAVWPYLATKYPDRRMGLVTSLEDRVIRFFFGFGYSRDCDFPVGMSAAEYTDGVGDLRERVFSASPNLQMFVQNGQDHTFIGSDLGRPVAEGVTLGDWLSQLLSGDPAWRTVGP